MNDSYDAFAGWWEDATKGIDPESFDLPSKPFTHDMRKWDIVYDLWQKAQLWDQYQVDNKDAPESMSSTNPWVVIDERIESVEQTVTALKQYFHNHSHVSTSSLPRPF